jgi:S1-C subfamily serine protease
MSVTTSTNPAARLGAIVVSVARGSAAETAGIIAGDEIIRVNGRAPRDIIEWQLATDAAEVDVEVLRSAGGTRV